MSVMALRGPASAAIIQAKTSTTQVRSAVATSESVVLIPHFARIEVVPAKKADANAARIQDKETSFHEQCLHLIFACDYTSPFGARGGTRGLLLAASWGKPRFPPCAGKGEAGAAIGAKRFSVRRAGRCALANRSGIVCSHLRAMAFA